MEGWCTNVNVFTINNDGVLKKKYQHPVKLKLDYDPLGYSLKILNS